MRYAILCIFLPSGRTFTFRNVEIVTSNESVLEFAYTAMSDGKKKLATFLTKNISGYSVTEDDSRQISQQIPGNFPK